MTDHWVARLLAPLALWVLLNGIDDLLIDVAALCAWIQRKFSHNPRYRHPTEEELNAVPARLMAVFVPLWKEHKVIQHMIDNNVTRLNYSHVEFFVGAYPNDTLTIAAVQEAMKRYGNVHLAVAPHNGPTSKADNLNWIYHRMLAYERERLVRFEMVLTHDAEDLIDPDALRWINYYAQHHDMVQIPVLALKKPPVFLAHGVYCDEFAEFQFKDMPARQLLGGFIPSNGVGTGFSRRALEMIAERYDDRIFESACITEDYENGFRVRRLGLPQKFIPIAIRHRRPIATREYFPDTFAKAVRQRTRWVMGITLQSWQFHSLPETLGQLYWFWRDRKALAGNLITPLMNLLFMLGFSTWTWAQTTHHAWQLAREESSLYPIYAAGLAVQALQTSIRIVCSARIYGWLFACGVPVRAIVANAINCAATVSAIWMYADARLHRRPLPWVKTEHAYPNRAALLKDRKRLGEVLLDLQWILPDRLEEAIASRPPDLRLGEHLVRLGLLTEQQLYKALSLQNNLPLEKPAPEIVSIPITRSLPARLVRQLRALPFRIAGGELYVAGSELPTEPMQRDIRNFSSLAIRFQLVTPTQFEELAVAYL
ncbi:MAG TPA: glycosyl transferase family protein [Bryobacteraceae bacterium]|nr:glycosyl transferase family protein [Bryobacteraceae bacterium]